MKLNVGIGAYTQRALDDMAYCELFTVGTKLLYDDTVSAWA